MATTENNQVTVDNSKSRVGYILHEKAVDAMAAAFAQQVQQWDHFTAKFGVFKRNPNKSKEDLRSFATFYET